MFRKKKNPCDTIRCEIQKCFQRSIQNLNFLNIVRSEISRNFCFVFADFFTVYKTCPNTINIGMFSQFFDVVFNSNFSLPLQQYCTTVLYFIQHVVRSSLVIHSISVVLAVNADCATIGGLMKSTCNANNQYNLLTGYAKPKVLIVWNAKWRNC